MPRYIDADELMQKICSVKYLRKIKSKQLIDECERIDAIPIEWIEQYIENEIKRYGCKIPETNSIQNMLNDWRKENESSISD